MAVVTEEDQSLPRPKRKFRLWPIPPLGRPGTPRGIVNATASLNTGGPWKPTSGRAETSYAEMKSPSPAWDMLSTSRPGSGRPPGKRPNAAWEVAAMKPNLLEALGIPSPTGGETAPGWMGRSMPGFKLKDPQECEEGCYWRWLVHTLLEDLAALKRNVEETEEAFELVAEKRRELEETIDNRDKLVEELAVMEQSIKTLQMEVPKLRQEHAAQVKEALELKKKQGNLVEQRREINAAIRSKQDWQKNNARNVKTVDLEAQDGRRMEKVIGEKIHMDRETMHQVDAAVLEIRREFEDFQKQVDELKEKKASKSAAKKKTAKK